MSLPSFDAFYSAVYGEDREPYPWQRRLVEHVLANTWQSIVLDLPTGSGKTSTLDIALYCLACAPDRMPRRTVLVVDRRIVVDQAAIHARHLLRRLAGAQDGAGKQVADALRGLTKEDYRGAPFRVTVMRGGMPRDNDWARWPQQPLLAMSTVDQLGSRLLFRGYGVNAKSASIHAGLIGNDTLVLLDEVHLANPFAQTLDSIRTHYRTKSNLPDRFHVVPMSATVRESRATHRFGLEDDDRRSEGLQRRLQAHKLATLIPINVSGNDEAARLRIIARHSADAAQRLQREGAVVVGVIVNRVDTARLVHGILFEAGLDVELLTGRMRPIERDHLVDLRITTRAGAGRDRATASPMIVVATQCLEAGADLDFDGLVTECASLDAMRQRFGRVDRAGELGTTHSVVLGRSDLVAADYDDPIYGRAVAATWQWLHDHASSDHIDFGIDWLPLANTRDGVVNNELLAEAQNAPVLLPAHLDAWAQTSIAIYPDPDVAQWLHGPEKPSADVQIVWRAVEDILDPTDSTALQVEALLETIRPASLEAVSVPLVAARRWLAELEPSAIADVDAGGEVPDELEKRAARSELSTDKRGRIWRWRGDDVIEIVDARQIHSGDVLVVDCRRGGLRRGSFDPLSRDVVADLGDLAQMRSRGIATLRLDPEALHLWGVDPATIPERGEEETEREFATRITDWLAGWPEPERSDANGLASANDRNELRKAFSRAHKLRITTVGNIHILTAKLQRPKADLDNDLPTFELVTESADSAFQAGEVSLRAHSRDVRSITREFAASLGFDRDLVEDLSLAGWLHDVGKADPRFQCWLVGGDSLRASVLDEPLAKSGLGPGDMKRRDRARELARYPVGYRHELLSLAMISSSKEILAAAHDPELVQHLVASHHGWCRPFGPPDDDPAELEVALEHDGNRLTSTTRHCLARLDSGVVDRFWAVTERYGWWGIAWLEAILRLADHRASELEERNAMEES